MVLLSGKCKVPTRVDAVRSEGELLHEEVHLRVELEAVQIVRVALQSHQQTSERHVRRPVDK